MNELHFLKESIKIQVSGLDISKTTKKDSQEIVPYFFKEDEEIFKQKKQPDIAYIKGMVVSSGGITQDNGFYFLKDLLIKNYKTLLHKPINIEHNNEVIVGHIYDVALVKRPEVINKVTGMFNYSEYEIDESNLIKKEDIDEAKGIINGYDGDVDVWIYFMFYKKYFNSLYDYIEKSVDNSSWKLGLSMELWYNKYGYLFDLDESTIVEKNADNLYLDDYIGRYYKNKKVYKVYLDDYIFAASAITDYPAELRSFIKDVANNINKEKTDDENVLYLKDNKKEISDLLELETKIMYGGFDEDTLDISNVFSLFNGDLLVEKELDIINDNVFNDISKTKKTKPKKYKDIPTSQFADPENYKYPLNSEKRVRAAIVYLSRYGGKYSADKRKKMWQKIIRAAKKYGIQVSDKIKKLAKASKYISDTAEYNFNNKNDKEVPMDELKKFFESIQGKLDTLVQKQTSPDVSSVVSDLKAMFTDKEMKLISDEIAKKDDMIKDLSTKLDELSKTKSELEEKLKTEVASRDSKIKELEESKKSMEEKVTSLEKDLSSYKVKEKTLTRLDEVRKIGIPLDEKKIDVLTEKASTLSDDAWESFMSALSVIDVSSLSSESKKDVSDKKDTASLSDVTIKDLGRFMLTQSEGSALKDDVDMANSIERKQILAKVFAISAK